MWESGPKRRRRRRGASQIVTTCRMPDGDAASRSFSDFAGDRSAETQTGPRGAGAVRRRDARGAMAMRRIFSVSPPVVDRGYLFKFHFYSSAAHRIALSPPLTQCSPPRCTLTYCYPNASPGNLEHIPSRSCVTETQQDSHSAAHLAVCANPQCLCPQQQRRAPVNGGAQTLKHVAAEIMQITFGAGRRHVPKK